MSADTGAVDAADVEPINPANRDAMRSWALEHVEPLSWRATYALDHPDEERTANAGYADMLDTELHENAHEMYRRAVPKGYVVVKQTDLRLAIVDGIIPQSLMRSHDDAVCFDANRAAEIERIHDESIQRVTAWMDEMKAKANATTAQAEQGAGDE